MILRLYFVIFISLLMIKLVNCAISWRGNMGRSCDFVNNDLSNARTSSEDCFRKCNETNGCTHFTWTTWNGGTCWMKKGIVYKDDAFITTDLSIMCGVMNDSNSTYIIDNSITPIYITILSNQGQLTSHLYILLLFLNLHILFFFSSD
ncbi:hypothetical protein I4U23_000186 [Adineta vaga]|nr:hypothetical protein I4U23_000186 [Adineta vaga]